MKTWLIAIMAMFANVALAEVFPAPYLNQNLHVERFAAEGWSGSYIQSLYVTATDSVRWEYCRTTSNWATGEFSIPCHALLSHTVNRADLVTYQPEVVQKLQAYRMSLAKKADQRFLVKYFGSAEADTNVGAIDEILAALKEEPLDRMILQREPARPDRTQFSDIQQTDMIAHILKTVFSKPVDSPEAIADSKLSPAR